MPPRKKGATRGGRFGRNGASSSSLSSSTHHGGPGSSTRRSAAILASAASTTPGRASSGRNTQNSKGNRGTARKTAAKKTPNSKPSNGRGRGRAGKKDGSHLQSPASYKAENGEVYKRGGTLTHACIDTRSHAKLEHCSFESNLWLHRGNWFYTNNSESGIIVSEQH